MRILYSHRVQSHDGQSVHIDELVSALRRAGHEVLVVGPKFYERSDFGGESHLIAFVRRLLPSALTEMAEILYNIPAYLRLSRSRKTFKPDVLYERYNLYFLAGALLSRRHRIPFYVEVNSPLAEERARFGKLGLRWLAQKLERFVWRSANRIFVVTAVLAEIVANSGILPARITVVPNGVDRDRFPDSPYNAGRENTVVIGFVGFVRPWHGLDAVIAGLAAEPAERPIRLVVVGPVSSDLQRQAEELGVADLVQFTGLKQRDVIPDVIRTFDIALQPRAVPYASPLKLFEYMGCGRAIVAPDQPNIREILVDGQTGVLFDPDDRGELWRAIRRLANDPELRERLGRAARRELEARDYTWQGNAFRVSGAVAADLAGHDVVVNATPHHDRS